MSKFIAISGIIMICGVIVCQVCSLNSFNQTHTLKSIYFMLTGTNREHIRYRIFSSRPSKWNSKSDYCCFGEESTCCQFTGRFAANFSSSTQWCSQRIRKLSRSLEVKWNFMAIQSMLCCSIANRSKPFNCSWKYCCQSYYWSIIAIRISLLTSTSKN